MEQILPFVFAGILLIIVFVLILISFQPTTPNQTTPSPTPAQVTTSPIPQEQIPQKESIKYDVQSSRRAYAMIDKKPPLSQQDASSKNDLLIAILRGIESGIVFESTNVHVEYVKVADIFHAEILTGNIEQAQNETVSWLQSKGLSKEGICRLPVIFYLSSFAAEQLQGKNITFYSLAPGC